MQVRRTLVIAVLSLLDSAAPGHAEGKWGLWDEVSGAVPSLHNHLHEWRSGTQYGFDSTATAESTHIGLRGMTAPIDDESPDDGAKARFRLPRPPASNYPRGHVLD